MPQVGKTTFLPCGKPPLTGAGGVLIGYSPTNYHGTCQGVPLKRSLSSRSPLSGSMLIGGRVSTRLRKDVFLNLFRAQLGLNLQMHALVALHFERDLCIASAQIILGFPGFMSGW